MSPMNSALSLIINVIFDAYIFILLLRLFLQKMGASWHNPITQAIIRLTNPAIKPLRRFVPGLGGFDLSIVLVALIVELLEWWVLMALKLGIFPGIGGTLIVSIGELLNKGINIFFFATLIAALMSWFPNLQRSALAEIVDLLSSPLTRLVRRFLPLMGGLDLSPIVILLGLQVLAILLVYPIIRFGMGLAL